MQTGCYIAASQWSTVFVGGLRAVSLSKPHSIWCFVKSCLRSSYESVRNLAFIQELKGTFLAHKLKKVTYKGSNQKANNNKCLSNFGKKLKMKLM